MTNAAKLNQPTTHVEAYVERSRDAGSIPAASTLQPVAGQEVKETANPESVNREHRSGTEWQWLALPNGMSAESIADLELIADHWDRLSDHVRTTILTLVSMIDADGKRG